MVRFNGAIFFGAVDHVQSSLMQIDEEDPLKKSVLIVASGIDFVDVAGAEMLAQEARRRRKMGGGLYFYRCKDAIYKFLRKADKLDDIGEGGFFPVMSNWIKPVYATLDPEICRTCKARIFSECHDKSAQRRDQMDSHEINALFDPRMHESLPVSFPGGPLRGETIKADLIAGITVALVLIPQSMAYAQLAGLPAYYGLYAAFLPGIIAALWGSSAQLATGPVAVVSLLTASALAPLAATGPSQFIALAILLALMVGIIQLALGVFKLGVVVNFLSHPVIVGFTNAAAIIIGLSQLNKLFGVSMGRSEHFIQDIWGVLQQVGDTHFPTLLMGVSAFAIMWGLKKFAPKLPGVLIAVTLTTVVSWSIGFEHNSKGKIEEIMDAEVKTLANEFSRTETKIDELNGKLSAKSAELKQHLKEP